MNNVLEDSLFVSQNRNLMKSNLLSRIISLLLYRTMPERNCAGADLLSNP